MLKNKLFFFGLIYAIIFTLSDKVYPEKADTPGPAVNTGAAKPFNYDPKGRRDPFIPLVNREGLLLLEPVVKKESLHQADRELYLEGIVYEPQGGSCAVINSEIVKAGDKIGDYQVLEVQRQKVVLGKAEEVLNLELRKEDE